MSEELIQKGLTKSGLKIGPYEFYNLGNTTLNQLKKYNIIQNKDYKSYGNRKPDAIVIDRRNKRNIQVIAVLEHKDLGKFKTENDQKETIRQGNDLAQVLGAFLGIATDGSLFIWFNPNQPSSENDYKDKTTGKSRSYALITDERGNYFNKEFSIDQTTDQEDINKLNLKTKNTLKNFSNLLQSISESNSQLISSVPINPSALAKQIWQDVWSVSGATPEKCLYTFVELFIFKYLSDLQILDDDDKGNKVNFKDIYALSPDKAFKNYSENVRPHLKSMFPPSLEDGTTIINGTVLNPKVPEHSLVFYKILKKFNDFGEMKNIDPGFKSKVFEDFMKESISKKNWGQYFTPRNIIDAIIELSDIENLPEDAEVCDPACGVGGFILEPIRVRAEDGLSFYYQVSGSNVISRYKFVGYDKGFENEERLTIILAKANMLIFLSELLKNNPTISNNFSELFNSTFKLISNTILGTLSKIEEDKYDLILTNPPYVTSGSSNYKEAIKNNSDYRNFYKVNAIGVEGLFLEWIIRSLKPTRKAFIVIPDGILNRLHDDKLRQFIKDECYIDGIISLPVNAFYTTPKKTYILAITKKSAKASEDRINQKQTDPVFTYLASNIGETLDVNRFTIEENDLIEAVSLFNQFKGVKTSFNTNSPRCKIQSIEKFNPSLHWSVDRWWTEEEQIALGIKEEDLVMDIEEFEEALGDVAQKLGELKSKLTALK